MVWLPALFLLSPNNRNGYIFFIILYAKTTYIQTTINVSDALLSITVQKPSLSISVFKMLLIRIHNILSQGSGSRLTEVFNFFGKIIARSKKGRKKGKI